MGALQSRMGWALLSVVAWGCSEPSDAAVVDGGEVAGGGSGGAGASDSAAGGSDAPAGTADAALPVARDPDGGPMGPAPGPADAGGAPVVDAGAEPPAACVPREVTGEPQLHFHHVHFNTPDPAADLSFFETFFNAPAVDFCRDGAGGVTRATQTERGYFLYTRVDEAPDPTLNTYLEHVGWIHPDPNAELQRLVALDVPLFPEGRAQCPEAFAGQMACGFGGYWFYLQAPSGARIEVARGPGPALSGFGHVHMIMGVDFGFFETVSDGAFQDGAIDMVNHTDASLMESILEGETVVETRGKPIDHIAYSTTDLALAKARLESAGIAIQEDIAWRPQYGFESLFVKSPKGIWVEIVADSPFSP